MRFVFVLLIASFSLSAWSFGDNIDYGEAEHQVESKIFLLAEDNSPAHGDSIGYNVQYPKAELTDRKTAGQSDDQTVLGDFIQY